MSIMNELSLHILRWQKSMDTKLTCSCKKDAKKITPIKKFSKIFIVFVITPSPVLLLAVYGVWNMQVSLP